MTAGVEPRMNTDEHGWVEGDHVHRVIGACFEVSNTLGAGFLEKVYERALAQELRACGIAHTCQQQIAVQYKGQVVGDYQADIIVENQLLLELKCVKAIANEHIAQTLNYLKATGLPLALIVNFAKPKLEWKRLAGPTNNSNGPRINTDKHR